MRKYLIITLLLVGTLSAFAQRPGNQRPNREQIKAARIAFLTSKLDLNTEQAQVFWPIFNEYEDERAELSRGYNQKKRQLVGNEGLRNMSDENADKMLDIYLDQKEAELKLERKYVERYRKVLNTRQIWQVVRFESEFRRNILGKMMKQRSSRNGGRPQQKTDDGN